MASAATPPLSARAAPPESVWRAPLVPAALAYTAGVLLDRYAAVPFAVSLLLTAGGMLGWLVARLRGRTRLPLVFLALAGAAFGAAYHHYRRDVYPADDVGEMATAEPRPVQMRGFLDEEPAYTPARPDPLRSLEAGESTYDRPARHGPAPRRRLGGGFGPRPPDDLRAAARPARRRRGGGGGPAVVDPRPGQPRRGRRRGGLARQGRPIRAGVGEDGRRRDAAGARLAGVVRRVDGGGARLGPAGAGRRAAAGNGRHGGGAGPRRRFRHDAGGMGSIHPHRRRPRPGDLRAAPHDPGGRALVGAAPLRRAPAARGRRRRRLHPGLRPADGRPAAGAAGRRRRLRRLRRAGAAPPDAAGQPVRPVVAGRRPGRPDGYFHAGMSAVVPVGRRAAMGRRAVAGARTRSPATGHRRGAAGLAPPPARAGRLRP